MYEKIMVTLDGSKQAEMVLPYAEEIAIKLGSKITLVSVSESAAADTEHLYHSYLLPAIERVQKQLEDWGAGKEAKVESKVLTGKAATEILRYADENKISLIAMTSRGSSVKGPWLLGNIATKVLRATSKPVLLVRAPAGDAALQQKRLVKRILVPLDGSSVGETAIPYAEALAKPLGAELILFQVLEPAAEAVAWTGTYESRAIPPKPVDAGGGKSHAIAYLESVGSPLKGKGLSVSTATALGQPANQIIDYAKDKAIDLIAMSTHGRSGIGRWVFGSIADKVLHSGDTAVLVVRAAKE